MTTYTPPTTAEEYLYRYPSFTSRHIRAHWRDLDFEDATQDALAHLFTPDGQGRDRISTYDGTKRGGCSEGAFLGYVGLIINRFLSNKQRGSQMQIVCASDSISAIAARYQEDDEGTALALVARTYGQDTEAAVGLDDAGLRFEAFMDLAMQLHPALPYVALAALEVQDEDDYVPDCVVRICRRLDLGYSQVIKARTALRHLASGNIEQAMRYRGPVRPHPEWLRRALVGWVGPKRKRNRRG